jgi:cation-transporting ATPase 13A3/4/5
MGLHRSVDIVLKNRFTFLNFVEWLLDGGWLPETVIRIGIRRQLAQRVRIIKSESLEKAYPRKTDYVKALRSRPIAIETDKANTQHYEVGTGVLKACLGPRMKYSCCLYPHGAETLVQAEVAMLQSYVQKADLRDGQMILDLGYECLLSVDYLDLIEAGVAGVLLLFT